MARGRPIRSVPSLGCVAVGQISQVRSGKEDPQRQLIPPATAAETCYFPIAASAQVDWEEGIRHKKGQDFLAPAGLISLADGVGENDYTITQPGTPRIEGSPSLERLGNPGDHRGCVVHIEVE